jgi:hypothetical protein
MKLTKEQLYAISKEMDFNFDKDTVFIETGTYQGETCFEVESLFNEIHTIEIIPSLYESFLKNKPSNVFAHLGDSAKKLLDVYTGTNKVIFWLDGHYVSHLERWSKVDCPLLEELKVINSKYTQECLILIDDVRLFDTNVNENWSGVNSKTILEVVKDRLTKFRFFGDVMALNVKVAE